jgi:hypothetical protein
MARAKAIIEEGKAATPEGEISAVRVRVRVSLALALG